MPLRLSRSRFPWCTHERLATLSDLTLPNSINAKHRDSNKQVGSLVDFEQANKTLRYNTTIWIRALVSASFLAEQKINRPMAPMEEDVG